MNFESITNLINWITVNVIHNKDLLSTLIGAFAGSLSAYQLNIRKEKRKEEQENLNNKNALISFLVDAFEQIGNIKQQVLIPKVQSMCEILEKKSKSESYEFKNILDTINKLVSLEFDLNKILFINEREPNLLRLISVCKQEINILNSFICQHDDFINQMYNEDAKNADLKIIIYPQQMGRLNSLINALKEKTNHCLFLLNKAIILLNDYSKEYFSKKPTISYIVPKEYKDLIDSIPPNDIPEGWDLEIENKTFWNEYLLTFNKWFNWFSSIIKKAKNWIKNQLKTDVIVLIKKQKKENK